MKSLTTLIGILAVASFSVTAQPAGSGVDNSDLPRLGATTPQGTGDCDANWVKAENKFMTCLNTEEKTMYQEMQKFMSQVKMEAKAFKDSVAKLTQEQRKDAIQTRTQLLTQTCDQLCTALETRLAAEVKAAKANRKAEVEKKRDMVRAHLDGVKARIQTSR